MQLRRSLRTATTAAAVLLLLTVTGCTTSGAEQSAPPDSAPPSSAAPTGAPAGFGGPEQAHKCPGDANLSFPSVVDDNDRTLTVSYKLDAGLSFNDRWFRASDSWSRAWSAKSGNFPPYGGSEAKGMPEYSAVIMGTAPGTVIMDQIMDGGKPTYDWVCAKFYSPSVGANQWACMIIAGNPFQGGKYTDTSNYTCEWSNPRGINPSPLLTVRKGTNVSDPNRQIEIVDTYCDGDNAAKRCHYVESAYTTQKWEPARIVGSAVENNGSKEAKYEIEWKTKAFSHNSIETGAKTSVELGGIWSAELSLKYGHEWGEEQSFADRTEISIEPGSIGWIEFAPRMQVTTGTWVIRGDDQLYLFPGVSGASPLRDGGKIFLMGCELKNYDLSRNVCKQGLTKAAATHGPTPTASP